MKYEGDIEYIDGILELVRGDIRCKQINDGGAKGDYKGMGVEDKSAIASLRFEIILETCMMKLKVNTNYRDGWGLVEMRDDKAWHLANAIPLLCGYMCKLTPFYKDKPRGQFLRAMDRLLIDEEGGAILVNNGRVGVNNGKEKQVREEAD